GYFRANRIRVFDVKSGEELLDRDGYPHRLLLSPDGRHLASTGEYDHSLSVWDRTTNKTRALPTPEHWPTSLAFTPDGKTLAVPVGNKVRLLETETGKELASLDAGVYVDVLAFAPDGKTLAAAGVEWEPGTNATRVLPRVTVLDVKTGKTIHTYT